MNPSEEIINKIQKGDNSVIISIYRIYRNDFIKWSVNKFNCCEEDAKDIFQEVIISFYIKIKDKKLEFIDYSLKTYLFACGKNLLLNQIKKSEKFINLSDYEITNDEIIKLEQMENSHHDKEQIKKALEGLSDDCQKILRLYYFDNYDLKSIAEKLGYKNADVVKVKKSQCMKKMAIALKKISKGLKMLVLL